ncbi:Cytosolic 5'-nucleotidase 3A [Holothuria leucospilota]|uniref:5'-nucleotidase n=1 Tax=Holothuria leucospilota TaxID=206669 RepID=A0A9Q1BAY2_HOLLE|nr:Cytosolic 5'-nucleotidase 3A [Holothuria leucospilota]
MWRSSSSVKVLLGASLVAVSAVAIYHISSRKKKRTRIIEMMEEFQKSNVHIRDSDRVEELVTQLIKGGKDMLQVVSDFDKTMSRHSYNGKRVPSCHGVLDNSEFLPESYRTEAWKLRNKYYPIEMSATVKLEEKYQAMVEWWSTAHGLLVNCDLTQSKVAQIVAKSEIRLRDGVNQTLELLHQNNVPLLIFSAGVGDILKEAIRQKAFLYENIFVISNFMDFNTEGKLVGFKGELIHTFNKHEVAVHHPEVFEKNKSRKNIILLGDTLGDLTMVDGMPYKENVLTIGFLNDHISENLEEYKRRYDIVLVDEGSFDLVKTILHKIF